MGDRRMAEIKVKDGSLYLYTHWGGSTLPAEAKAALLVAQPRIGDDAYALRIVVDQLTKEGRDSENGFGLMLKPECKDSYNDDKPSVIIDLVENKIRVVNRGAHDLCGVECGCEGAV